MPPQTLVKPRKKPRQARSQATVDAILESAARILRKKGYEGFNTNEVAKVAGVSVGSLYQYFPNKNALLSELMRQHILNLEESMDEALVGHEQRSLEDVTRRLISSNVELHRVDPELHRVLSEEVPRLEPLDWREDFEARIHARLVGLFEAHREEMNVKNLDVAIYIIAQAVEGAIHSTITKSPELLDGPTLEDELTRMILGYLRG